MFPVLKDPSRGAHNWTWAALTLQEPYVVRDLDENAISLAAGQSDRGPEFQGARRGAPTQADEEQRGRGRTSQVLDAQFGSVSRGDDKRGDLPRYPASSSVQRSSRPALLATPDTVRVAGPTPSSAPNELDPVGWSPGSMASRSQRTRILLSAEAGSFPVARPTTSIRRDLGIAKLQPHTGPLDNCLKVDDTAI